MKNYGLNLEPAEASAHIFGASVPFPEINPTGQWDKYLPDVERQRIRGIETQACTSYGTLSALEILVRYLYSRHENWSDRWLAWNSGTNPERGNDPHRVAETLRKAGDVKQEEWDFDGSVKSVDDFYKNPPPKLFETARVFNERYVFKHQYVTPTVSEIKEALKVSPLGVSVTAWRQKDGLYYASKKSRNNHWCVLYGFDDKKKAWKIFDSYDDTEKLYTFDSPIEVVKVYYLGIGGKDAKKTLLEILLEPVQQLLAILLENKKKDMTDLPTKRELLLEAVKGSLGIDASPADKVSDSFGCAETASMVLRQIDLSFPLVTGTWSLWDVLKTKCKEVKTPMAGDIIICVTGTPNNGTIPNGHVGFFLNDTDIASNDSASGLFLKNYTLHSWRERYERQGGYKVYFYRV